MKIHPNPQPSDDQMANTQTQVVPKKAECQSKLLYWIPRILLVTLLAVVITIFVIYRDQTTSFMEKFLIWAKENTVAGPFLIALVVYLTVIFLLPYSIVAVSSGYIFYRCFENKAVAILVGTISVFVGAWLAALTSFLLGRYLLRDQVTKLSNKFKIVSALDKALETQGFKFVLLLRLCLLIPFNITNYVLGGSAVRFTDYLLGSLAVVVQNLFFVYIGTTISKISDALSGGESLNTTSIIVMSFGVLIALGGVIYVSLIVRRQLTIETEKKVTADVELVNSHNVQLEPSPSDQKHSMTCVVETENENYGSEGIKPEKDSVKLSEVSQVIRKSEVLQSTFLAITRPCIESQNTHGSGSSEEEFMSQDRNSIEAQLRIDDQSYQTFDSPNIENDQTSFENLETVQKLRQTEDLEMGSR